MRSGIAWAKSDDHVQGEQDVRLEIGEYIGQCKLWITPAERGALVDAAVAKTPPELPEEVLEHLKSHGHWSSSGYLGAPGLNHFLGLAVHVEPDSLRD